MRPIMDELKGALTAAVTGADLGIEEMLAPYVEEALICDL